MDFILHPQLEKDCFVVGNLSLCRVLLMNDARFPWLVLVPQRENLREIIDVLPGEQTLLWEEINAASRALQKIYTPDKLNIAALGNMVPQLHIHIIARFKTDAAWPKPVWGVGTAEAYKNPDEILSRLRAALCG